MMTAHNQDRRPGMFDIPVLGRIVEAASNAIDAYRRRQAQLEFVRGVRQWLAEHKAEEEFIMRELTRIIEERKRNGKS